MNKVILSIAASFGILAGCGQGATTAETPGSTEKETTNEVSAQPSEETQKDAFARNINVAEFEKMEKTYRLLDVRTAEECAQGTIDGAPNIDIYDPEFKSKVDALDRNETYVIYCRSGARSAQAMQTMQSMGFKYLYNLQGGYMAYSASR